jgi:hypothetical protein
MEWINVGIPIPMVGSLEIRYLARTKDADDGSKMPEVM